MTIRLSALPAPRIVLPVLAAVGLAAVVVGAPDVKSARAAWIAAEASGFTGFDKGLPVFVIAPIEVTARRSDGATALASPDAHAAARTAPVQCAPSAS